VRREADGGGAGALLLLFNEEGLFEEEGGKGAFVALLLLVLRTTAPGACATRARHARSICARGAVARACMRTRADDDDEGGGCFLSPPLLFCVGLLRARAFGG
jgi:hypothetical protein